jgi:hypothetical protein
VAKDSPRTPPPQSRLYSLSAAATAWGISLGTLYRHIGHKHVKTVRVGNSRKIAAAEFERVSREGLAPLVGGYRRLTSGKAPGRPRRKS